MKAEIHPTYYPEAKVTCACGNSWTTGATKPEIRTDVCYNCHPFYTGEQRIVDTEGQVDRFYKRLQARAEYLESEREREVVATSGPPIAELGLSNRATAALGAAGFAHAQDLADKLAEEGDNGLLAVEGIGRQALAEVKKALRSLGLLETAEAAE